MKTTFTSSPWKVIAFVVLIIIVLTSPFWLWELKSSKELNVLILDKTVPDKSFREHKGLVWLLNNQKYKKSDQTTYDDHADYDGVVPVEGNNFKIKPLPKDLDKYAVYYLTDQYGVYEKDLNGTNPTGERSKTLYGGLSMDDLDKIEHSLIKNKGKTLIAEFNTFASPTENDVKEKVSNLLNLDWDGWIGRYFSDLSSKEVPVWIKKDYESKNGKWNYKGKGIVLVNQNDFVVVLDQSELKGSGADFLLTDNGKKAFGHHFNGTYQYWFDIVHARNQQEVLANYHLSVTKDAQKKLKGFGIPTTFPAVVHQRNAKYTSYYFAGDYADEPEVPDIYQTVGLTRLKEYFGAKGSFYWKVYVPMMKQILSSGINDPVKPESVETSEQDGVKLNSKTNSSYLQILKNGKWENFLVKGVNMGIAKPGAFPGETAISKDEYLRWFKEIGEMNANTIRVYTLHPPAFYEAFYEYNQTAKKPLYLIHGAWVNEESLVRTQDAYSKDVTEDFRRELKDMVDIIHGKASIPANPGHASGEYKYDISRYVLGYMLGIEWDPEAVEHTNDKYKGKPQFSGHYFHTDDASPFEMWLAENMEYTMSYESETYHWQHSMSFTNWPTTDLLHHPAEPSKDEDLVSVDPNHIKSSNGFHAGLFASYHIYPYYPDFLNYEKDYTDYVDKDGKKNNYAGYLHDLISKHQMPVLVAEFGVPASRGMTHRNASGMNQGFHSEKEQGEIDKRLFENIVDEGYAGGLVFTWQDEWFKRTWNTMEYDDPNRRPFWSNMQTNEQHFGLLGFEPGKLDDAIYVDGNDGDWEKKGTDPIYQSKKKDSSLKKMYVSSDDAYLYLRVDYSRKLNLQQDHTYVLLDTIQNQGQKAIPIEGGKKINTDFGIDFLVEINGKKNTRVFVDSYYDPFEYQYGHLLHMIPPMPTASQKNNGVFNPIRYALNKPFTIPSTGKSYGFQSYETGKLLFGTANPDDKNFNSLTDISVSDDKKSIELRIPWMLLNMKDPSQKEILGDLWKSGLEGKDVINGIKLAVVETNGGSVSSEFPQQKNDLISGADASVYTWNNWEEPQYHERLKQSYEILQDAYKQTDLKEDAN
ncbi:type 1 periplasmic-binding domain-containing protein [Falsibacillus albus]|uniref:Uncharacterized protein n=1 Tax=Falsibacillus albus TaxID=2478915 RepID=A0A3L7K2D6_9BACI|nr:hypothetical protein [Falsibacillus albus]RLQ96141.1 hypothetical protein D9X91_07575 [Falsibacillus albus]